MARKQAPAADPGELRTIEALAKAAGTPDWVLAGATVHYGWGAGKEMTEQEYRKAIDRFLSSPIGGDNR